MTTMVADRTLYYFGDDGAHSAGFARLYLPFDQGQNWRCEYHLSWLGYEQKRYACGEDSWQALQLAMQIVPVEISATEAFKAGRLGCFGARMTTNADLVQWLAPQSMKVLDE